MPFTIPTLNVTAVIDILAVAFIIYQLLQIVRGTRAFHILVGILTVVVVYEIALRTGLEALRTILEENDAIEVQSIVYPAGYDGLEYRIGSAAANNPDVFTQDESRVLDFVATTFGRLNAKEISDRSHKETAWTKTPAKELISYHHAQHLSVRLPAR